MKFSTILKKIIRKTSLAFVNCVFPAPNAKHVDASKVGEFINATSGCHFQFNYGLKLNSGVSNPHIRHLSVCNDILFSLAFNRRRVNFLECCCMDGYLSWRLSGQRSKYFFNSLTANDIDTRNINKIIAYNIAFGINVNQISGDMNNLEGRYDICTILGSSYFLDYPLSTLSRIIERNLAKNGVLYIDFRCHPEDNFLPRHILADPESIKLYTEGLDKPIGLRFEFCPASEDLAFINRPEKYTCGIYYHYRDILKFIEKLPRIKSVRPIYLENEETETCSATWVILKITT